MLDLILAEKVFDVDDEGILREYLDLICVAGGIQGRCIIVSEEEWSG